MNTSWEAIVNNASFYTVLVGIFIAMAIIASRLLEEKKGRLKKRA